ncbi:Hypothetical predicted protein [Cloeon dipterum]|uniref:Peptidase S1 domain-containing protein n=1 Tax=Cloeon dipterum TaxID=197152 RepID=A0A8S1CTD4_9INSE|nr:Hypothetical predicted protein [Cloeon dipterum]
MHQVANQTLRMSAMKIVIALISLVVAAQAVDWHNIKPKHAFKNPIKAFPKTDRIIGGTNASPGLLPFQAGIFADAGWFCGGSLIKNNKVLTAAHCCDGSGSFEVHLGAQDIYDLNEANLQIVTSSNGQVHEQYNPSITGLDNDICIIHLDATVSGQGIAPVRLPSRSQVSETFVGYTATVSGWGLTSDEGTTIWPDLQYVSVNVITNAECDAYYGTITDIFLCTGTEGGTAGTCSGDSGGPLTIVEPDGLRTQVGTFSFVSGAGCESAGPNGYARLTKYLNWLETNAGVTIRP